jgi:cell division transport system permease protein
MAQVLDYVHPLFKLTLNNIRRHPVINFISIAIITVAMLLLSLYFLAYSNVTRMVSAWRTDLKIIVYLEDDITPDRLTELKDFCRELDEVEALTLVSKEQALENFRKSLGENADFLDDLPENPLPVSLELALDRKVAGMGDLEHLARQLGRQAGVEKVVYGSWWLHHLFSLLRIVKYFGLLFAAFISGVTIFIVASTIRLSLYSRRETIRVLHLVGASRAFVALPYFLEGLFQGTMASLLALGLSYGGYLNFRNWLQTQVPQWSLTGRIEFFAPLTIMLFVFLGTGLGVAGFLLSSRWDIHR